MDLNVDKNEVAGVELEMQGIRPRVFVMKFNLEGFFLILVFLAVVIIGVAHAITSRGSRPVAGKELHEEMTLNPLAVLSPDVHEEDARTTPKNHTVRDDSQEARRDADYILRFQKVAIAEHRKYGIPASIKMAQALLESNAGTSRMAKDINNHFGMKCHARSCEKGHCKNYHDDSHKDFFRAFDSAWASWRAHSVLLSGERYNHLPAKCGNDYKCWAKGLKEAGYATDRNYATKLIKRIEQYNLQILDDGKTFSK